MEKHAQGHSLLEDSSDIAVVYIGCGVPINMWVVEALMSLAAQTKIDRAHARTQAAFQTYLFMDKDGAEDLVKRPQYTKAASIINITIVSIEGMAIPKEFKNLDVARCADVRLAVPIYLKEERIMYFDVDTLMTGPVVPALAQVMTEHAEQALFIAEEVNSENCSPGADGDLHCSWYNRHVSNGPRVYGKTGLNAGIVGINGRRWRELDFDRQILQMTANPKAAHVRTDQDILNSLALDYGMQVLPCEFNVRPDSRCYWDGKYLQPLMLHGSRGAFSGCWRKEFVSLRKASMHALGNKAVREPDLWQFAGLSVDALKHLEKEYN